jgi:hypothetical protein
MEAKAMQTPFQRHQRIRAMAMSVGMVLGMAATTMNPHIAHAATTASKALLSQKTALLPVPTVEQLAAAERVLVGGYECEFGKRVSIDPQAANQGYFTLKLGKQTWTMKPVLSNTGAVRLEDVKGNALMIQILTKSMLMDTKKGQRMVDGCVHEVQRAAEADLAKQPPRPSLLDSPAAR